VAKKQTPPHPHRIRIQVFQLIEAKLGKLAVRDLTATAVRAWFAGLDSSKPTRNGHAYAILNMICNTAIKDGLVDRNPCDVRGAMNPKVANRSRFRPRSNCTVLPTSWALTNEPPVSAPWCYLLVGAECGSVK